MKGSHWPLVYGKKLKMHPVALAYGGEKMAKSLDRSMLMSDLIEKAHKCLSHHQVAVSWSHIWITIFISQIVLAALFCVTRHFVFKTEILSVIPLSEKDTAQAPSVIIFLFLVKITAEEWNWRETSFNFIVKHGRVSFTYPYDARWYWQCRQDIVRHISDCQVKICPVNDILMQRICKQARF